MAGRFESEILANLPTTDLTFIFDSQKFSFSFPMFQLPTVVSLPDGRVVGLSWTNTTPKKIERVVEIKLKLGQTVECEADLAEESWN